MSEAEPIPPHIQRAAIAWARYKKIMRWMVLVAAVAVLLALAYLRHMGGGEMSIHMIIATIAGVGLSVLLGTGLMGLVFLSNAGGHDEQAGKSQGERE